MCGAAGSASPRQTSQPGRLRHGRHGLVSKTSPLARVIVYTKCGASVYCSRDTAPVGRTGFEAARRTLLIPRESKGMRIALLSTPFLTVPPRTYGGTELVVLRIGCRPAESRSRRDPVCHGRFGIRGRSARSLWSSPHWPPEPLMDLNHISWALQDVSVRAATTSCMRIRPRPWLAHASPERSRSSTLSTTNATRGSRHTTATSPRCIMSPSRTISSPRGAAAPCRRRLPWTRHGAVSVDRACIRAMSASLAGSRSEGPAHRHRRGRTGRGADPGGG